MEQDTLFNNSLHQRTPSNGLQKQSQSLSQFGYLQFFADSVSEFVTVLNENRQIVFFNKPFGNIFGTGESKDLLGLRPGEAMRCANAANAKWGCGTTDFCKLCGAHQAIVESLKGTNAIRECRLTREENIGALDFLVRATPLTIGDEHFTIFAASDISNEKRRNALENIFFHDVLNSAGGLIGYSELLKEAEPVEREEFTDRVHELAVDITDQIEAQRELINAENSEITVAPATLHSLTLITSTISSYQRHPVAENKIIAVGKTSEDFVFVSDEVMAKRVLGNLTKNALEGSDIGGTVTIGCKRVDNEVHFWVHNEKAIPRDVQLQIFQRSFSTKGTGRGLGTYSVKLLTERYLKGWVKFESTKENGTTFFVTFPMVIKEEIGTLSQSKETVLTNPIS
jgi:signal transduction histidine kinase